MSSIGKAGRSYRAWAYTLGAQGFGVVTYVIVAAITIKKMYSGTLDPVAWRRLKIAHLLLVALEVALAVDPYLEFAPKMILQSSQDMPEDACFVSRI